jgi:hypothetical protein
MFGYKIYFGTGTTTHAETLIACSNYSSFLFLKNKKKTMHHRAITGHVPKNSRKQNRTIATIYLEYFKSRQHTW